MFKQLDDLIASSLIHLLAIIRYRLKISQFLVCNYQEDSQTELQFILCSISAVMRLNKNNKP